MMLLQVQLTFYSSIQVQVEQMKQEKDTQGFNAARWLFTKRLQFLSAQQDLVARTQSYQISQDLFQGAKKNDAGPIGKINNLKDLKEAYKFLNSFVYRCRFNAKNLDQTFVRSKNELKNKKHLKQTEKHCKNKVRRILEILRIPQDAEEHWRMVLNHKNVIEHVLKANVFLKSLLVANFQLIKEGGAHLKDEEISKQLQVLICILIMDMISLISTIKNLLVPFIQDDNNPANNKVELEEKISLENALQNANEANEFAILKNLEIQRFFATIKRITSEMKMNSYAFKVWVSIQDIRQSYLVDSCGLALKRFHATAAKELMLYWMHVYNEHFNKAVNFDRQPIDLKQIFADYKIMFNYFLGEAIKKKEQSIHVIEYLDLIQKIWVMIDLASASSLFWEQLAIASKKITLPTDFAENSKHFILDIVNNIISTFQQQKNKNFLEKIKLMVLNFSTSLLTLEQDEDLTEHYFLKGEKQIRLLLTERNGLKESLQEMEKLVKGSEGDILNVIGKVMHMMANKKEYRMEMKYEKEVLDGLYHIYEQEHHLIDEIKYFLLMARCLSNSSPSQEELEACLKYYSSQQNGILTNGQNISAENSNNMRFGLLDCIKNFTFELVLNIKLNKPSAKLDRLKKIIYKLLKIYQQKRNEHLQGTDEIVEKIEEDEISINSLLLKRSSSIDFDPNLFQINAQDLQGLEKEEQREDDFTMSYLKKIFELRIEMIVKNINDLEAKQIPFREQFISIKERIYKYAANSEKDDRLRQDVKKMPEIQLDFIKKRYFQAWSALRQIKDIEGINKILEKAWDGKRNLLKLFVMIYLRYKEPIFQRNLKGKDLQTANIQELIDDALQSEHRNIAMDSALRQNIINSIRILDSIEKITQLKRELMEQDEQLSSMEEAKHFKSIYEEVKFKQLQDKLEIHTIMKNDIIIMRKYVIKVEQNEREEVHKKLRKLTQFNRNITLELNKQKDIIIMKVDQIQNVFESYPKLVKFLIESYLEIVEFCQKQLHLDLYPLMLHNHFKIHKKNEHNIILKMNPYEGILFNIILSFKQLKATNQYKYPKYPFIQLADQLAKKFEKDKIYDKNAIKAESFAFNHLIEEMKALSMEIQNGNAAEIAKAILKCPYFWSSADKLFEIVQFKQRYQSIVNIEESRRKQNEKIRESLSPQERATFTYWPPQKKHPNYKPAYGYNKTNQVYFSIEGLLERQAFEQDIGNFKGKDSNLKYKFHGYVWSKDKVDIQRLVKMVAEREKKKGSKTSFYDKTFNSFQNQIRNLRNLSVHYIYDSDLKKQVDLEDKLNIFETYFPKLFVFLYRWRPFLGKDYVNDIKPEKISLLKQLFCKEDNSEIIARLSDIKELQTYNKKNNYNKDYLLDLFNYDVARVNGCEPCKILCNSLKKQASFWSFLEDIKRENYKQGKDMTYNLLFWDHDKKRCNGMINIIFPYFNVTQRNQFTTEEFAHVQSSLTMMQIEKERLQQKIEKKLQKIAEAKRNKQALSAEEEQDTPGSDAESIEIQNKNRQPVEIRFENLTARQLDRLHDELVQFDYVCKYFIYTLEMKFPYLFYDLRKQRYQWDEKAWQYPKKE